MLKKNADELGSATLASELYERIRNDILAGRLVPYRKLQARFLMEQYNGGQTPIREALNRLTSDKLVECVDQRGFYVAGISREKLQELNRARCLIEGIAIRASIEAQNDTWEDELILSFYKLKRIKRSRDAECFTENPEWEVQHRAFHRMLVTGCGSGPLIGFCDQLADQLFRYRRLAAIRAFPDRNVAEEHKQILDAVLDHDAELAASLLVRHYERTVEVILKDESLFSISDAAAFE